jgi:hypothetical protein
MGEFDFLEATYDLSYRPKVGDTSYYRLDIVYRTLDGQGLTAKKENYRGDFRRAVQSVEGSGRVVEEITWQNVARREVEGDADFGPLEPIEWAQGFSYPFSAEDSYKDFHWGYDSFPRDLVGWNVLLLTVDAHFEFDFLRSSHHGAIEKLRRIGDAVVTPDSGTPFWLGLPPLVDVPAFNKQNLRNTFQALTHKLGAPCGVIAFDMDPSPFEMDFAGTKVAVSSSFAGTLTVRLSDGALEHGEFLEFVFGMPDAVCVSPCYEIVRIDESEYGS